MEKHYALSDAEFETQFAAISLEPGLFSHEAHLRLAWIHISKYGVKKAIDTICNQIQAFAHTHGARNKYNVTVTIAAIRAVYHFTLKSAATTFPDFIAEFPQLKTKFKNLLESHYSSDIFRSKEAKKNYLPPDRAPFDDIQD